MSDNVLQLGKVLLDSSYLFILAILKTPFAPVLFIVIIVPFYLMLVRLYKPSASPKPNKNTHIDSMGGQEFEIYLEHLFRRNNYHVERTQYSGDYGADLILHRDGVKTVVQAKRWNNRVGVKGIQEIVAARGHYRADSALLITNNYLTKQALSLAKSNGVEVWERDKLLKIVRV